MRVVEIPDDARVAVVDHPRIVHIDEEPDRVLEVLQDVRVLEVLLP